MKTGKLKAAVAIGSAALLWSIPSLNIFGIIGTIMSWSAYGGGRRKTALGAGAFYIAALVVSIIFGILLAIASKDFLSSEFGAGLSDLLRFSVLFSLFGDVLYCASAVCSFIGAKELTGAEGKGFFD
ncbi:MAG: hypothetical protein NC078_05885 [Ruminococcus sp.]|nr:hypothetical protein [Ruminococcus sp.]